MEFKDLRRNSFNEYPHYIYTTAFLVNGVLADYKICDSETCWGLRTFRGSKWENEVSQHGFIDQDWELTCVYHSEWVQNRKEHNAAFDKSEKWLKETFKDKMMKHVQFSEFV